MRSISDLGKQRTGVRRQMSEERDQRSEDRRWEGAKVREGMNSEVGRKHRTEL